MLGSEWHLTTSGSDMITGNGTIPDVGKIYESALNYDLKEICSPVLANELSKDILCKTVLQIQKIRNISAPKANEDSQAAPRMLKLTLTDGDTFIQAVELSPIGSISRNHTPPGSKVLINKAKIVSGYLLLTASNCKLLGGKVPHLVEKWELSKSVNRHHGRNSCEDGPPPWVSFGKRLQTEVHQKNVDSSGKSKETKENHEFEIQRQGAIAEAATTATPKVFGGRVKQNIQVAAVSTTTSDKNGYRRDQGKNKTRNQPKEIEDSEMPSKPSDKLSLFSFLEDKLPSSEATKSGGIQYSSDNRNKDNHHKYNNMDSRYTDKSYQYQYTGKTGYKTDNNINNIAHSKVKQSGQMDKPYAGNNMFGERGISSKQSQRWDIKNKATGDSCDYSSQNSICENGVSKPAYTFVKPNNYQNDPNPPHFSKNSDASLRNNRNLNNKSNYTNYQSNQQYYKPQTNNLKKDNMQSSFTHESKFQPPTKVKYDQQAVSDISILDPTSRDGPQTTEVPEEIQNFGKLSLNTQFASRSLRQHLNLGAGKKIEEISNETGPSNRDSNEQQWKVGDEILAKYWEDGRFYNATVTAVTDKTFAVKFKGYGNIEEILKHDVMPIPQNSNRSNKNYLQNRQYGSMEFRRSNRSYK